MVPAIITGVVTVLVAIMTVLSTRLGPKHERELLDMEIELRKKVPVGSQEYLDLGVLIRDRTHKWKRGNEIFPQALNMSIVISLLALTFRITTQVLFPSAEDEPLGESLRSGSIVLIWMSPVPVILAIYLRWSRDRAHKKASEARAADPRGDGPTGSTPP